MQRIPEKGCDTAGNAILPETGFLRLPEVLRIYPVSKSTWWDLIRKGQAPKPVKLSRRCAAWKVADIRALIESRTDISASKEDASGRTS